MRPTAKVAVSLSNTVWLWALLGLGAGLGAAYDSGEANILFRVYSSRATRIELWLYKQPTNFNQSVRYVMVKDAATNITQERYSAARSAWSNLPRKRTRSLTSSISCRSKPSRLPSSLGDARASRLV